MIFQVPRGVRCFLCHSLKIMKDPVDSEPTIMFANAKKLPNNISSFASVPDGALKVAVPANHMG